MATKINNISISDAEFTRLQELGAAFVLQRALKDKKVFNSPEDIIRDKTTRDGIEKIFIFHGKKLFNLKLPMKEMEKHPREWVTTFYLQQEKLLKKFSGAAFKVFNREEGFMNFISNLIRKEFKISKKDSWNPADIWLIRKAEVFRDKITKELDQPSATKTVKELNAIMRSLFRNKDVVGISLKKISGQTAKYEEINLDDKFYKHLESHTGEYDFSVSKIYCKLGLKGSKSSVEFATQDTVIFLQDSTKKDIAKFQIKGNTTSGLSNLKFEGTEIAASSARLGKAPLELVEKLSGWKDYVKLKIYNSQSKSYRNYPKTIKEWNGRKKLALPYSDVDFEKVFKRITTPVNGIKVTTELKASQVDKFVSNMSTIFKSKNPHIATSKLMQMYFVDKILQLTASKRNEYLTDLLFIAQKKGKKVFDFGPFGKLY